MILCDTGPLIALVDDDDARHFDCTAILPVLSTPLITTWACFVEAMYMLGRYYGSEGQNDLWHFIANGSLTIYEHEPQDLHRMRALMQKYQNVPMDLADASLVAAAETLNLTRIFTLDADFRIYRINDITPFEIVP